MKDRGPLIRMRDGEIDLVVDEAERALLNWREVEVYQRGQELAEVSRLDHVVDDEGVRRQAGAVILRPLSAERMTELMERSADWRALRNRPGMGPVWMPATPRTAYPLTLLKRGRWQFPVIKAVVTAPTMALDGRVIQDPGYDAESGIYLDFGPSDFPRVPDKPTREDALSALTLFGRPLREMPWNSGVDKSVAYSAGLTALVRSSLRAAPLHAFDAPTAGTGKSLCCDWVSVIKTGTTAAAMSQGKNPEEDEKRLSSCLYAGDNLILLDNCALPIEGDFLCSMLTQEVVQARILGQTKKVTLPSTALIIASGNNLSTRDDMTRRVVKCRLDSHTERPDERVYDFNVKEETLRDRGLLAVAGLTVLRAYAVAGFPKVVTRSMGSFEDWSKLVRSALVWLDEADPLDSREELIEGDSQKSDLGEILEEWEAVVGRDAVGVEKMKAMAGAAHLVEMFQNVACGGRDFNSKRVGWWLRKHKDQVLGGRAFKADRVGQKIKWHIASAGALTSSEEPALPF